MKFHHVSWYPPCRRTAVTLVYMDIVGYSFHKSIQCIVSWWFPKTSSTTSAVFTCYLSTRLKGVIFMADALHPLPKWSGHSTPSPNTSINWQWISRAEMFCRYKLSHRMTKFPLHINVSLNSMIIWLLHHLLHVTSITVSTSHHKIKLLLQKL